MTRAWLTSLLGGCVLVIAHLVTVACPVIADDQASRPQYAKLVDQLGSLEYREREAAAKKLFELGIAAKDALQMGVKSDDLEIRMRSQHLLTKIRETDYMSQMNAFIDQVGNAPPPNGWKEFSAIVGESRDMRILYVLMNRKSPDLFQKIGKDGFTDSVNDHLAMARKGVSGARLPVNNLDHMPDEIIAAALFLADPQLHREPQLVSSQLYQFMTTQAVKDSLIASSRCEALTKLLRNWVNQQDGVTSTRNAMRVCSWYSLTSDGLPLARRIVDEKEQKSYLADALCYLAKNGDYEVDGQRVTDLLDDHRDCHTWINVNEVIKVQVCDVALAVALYMAGEDPKNYGYKYLKSHPRDVYQTHTMCFKTDEERQAALKKWQEFSKSSE